MTNPLTILADNVKPGIANTQGGVNTVGTQGDTLVGNVTNIINGVVAALGIVAVVVIIFGGIQYMTSSGDAGKVKTAKNTILYGIVGLVICVLAFAIVNFVIKSILEQQ